MKKLTNPIPGFLENYEYRRSVITDHEDYEKWVQQPLSLEVVTLIIDAFLTLENSSHIVDALLHLVEVMEIQTNGCRESKRNSGEV